MELYSSSDMGMSSEQSLNHDQESGYVLQLLLFVDNRTAVQEQISHIRAYLEELREQESFEVEVVDVHDQPYLAEHFKLIATPALVKTFPPPRHVLAGSSLIEQLEECWPRWQQSLADHVAEKAGTEEEKHKTFAQSVQLMQLSDELFQLRQKNESLRDQLEFKDRMITILAHDLRNPLTAAAIAVETLEYQWKENSDSTKILKPEILVRLIHQAQLQIQNIDRMITNLLETSRARSADLQIHPRKLNLKQLSHNILTDIESTVRQKSLQLNTDIPNDIPDVHADENQIRQVFMNLLDNAAKYTPAGGEIKVTVLHRTTQKVQVCICDDGLGIPLEKQKSIFEDSVRLKRDEQEKGYGLGLALCRRIIRAHYGQIWVDSTPNEGSCFNFTLPVYR